MVMAQVTLGDVSREVEGQPEALERFAVTWLPRAPDGSIFVGAGDSYAAALAGFYASRGKCLALDPYALAGEPGMARGREVFLISVSGRTSANVFAAKRVRDLAAGTTALTAVSDSPLARTSGRVVRLPMDYSPKTPGMLSFTLAALATMIIAGAGGPCDFAKVFGASVEDSRELTLGGTTYFLGNSLAHPAALYAAAKVQELLGSKAHGQLLEEFSHIELFSLAKGDAVNVFGDFDPSRGGAKLARALEKGGFRARAVPSRGRNGLERFLHCVFVGQLLSLESARKAGCARPTFLADKRRLRISDSMIY